MIPDLGIDLPIAFAQPIGKASPDILTKCICTPASRYDVHVPNRAPEPPRPVGITDHSHTGSCSLARTVVPTDSPDSVGSKVISKREVDDWIERPCVLSGTGPRCLKVFLGRRVDR